ncbi:MAG: hypothetical protein ACR2RL_00680, partial [Gammaproteobacteria bacterium]
ASDITRLVPEESPASLRPLKPLFKGMRDSGVTLVVQPWDPVPAYFMATVNRAGARRDVRVHQTSLEVATKAFAEGKLPVLSAKDVQRAAIQARDKGTPMRVPIKYLIWRENIPAKWREAARKILATNAEYSAPKAQALCEPLENLRAEERKTVVGEFLARCIWIDNRSEQLGYLAARRMWRGENDHFGFSPYPEGDAKMRAFARSLSRNNDGRLTRRRGLARVIPMLSSQLAWSSPTLQIHDERFRLSHGLDMYYSIYRGLEALSQVAAPLLVYEPGTLDSAIPVDLVQTSLRPEEYLFVSAPEIKAQMRSGGAGHETLSATMLDGLEATSLGAATSLGVGTLGNATHSGTVDNH